MQRSINVPVGLIHSSWSASKIEAWMSRQTLQQFSEVKLPDVNQSKFGWEAGTPTLLWNAMVNPWKGFPVRGVIWYQGEANVSNPALYKRLFQRWCNNGEPFLKIKTCPSITCRLRPIRRAARINSNGHGFASANWN
ncbi:MAG: sialate O-acetylesterase [Hoylesella buccalis]